MSIISPESLLDGLLKMHESSVGRKGLSTGYESLDDLMLLNKQYLMLITGYPNFGKSAFLDALAVNSAMQHDWKWLYFSTETDNYTSHLSKLVNIKTGKPIHKCTAEEIKSVVTSAERNFAWINPKDALLTLDDVIQITKERIQAGHEVDVLVIDPWNELNHCNQSKRDDQYISDCMLKLRKFHRKYNVLSIVVIHPHSIIDKTNKGDFPIPHLRDCAGGAMWWNKADYGICVHRKDFSIQGAHIYVQKVKDQEIGRQGATWLDYDVFTRRFKDSFSEGFHLPEKLPF